MYVLRFFHSYLCWRLLLCATFIDRHAFSCADKNRWIFLFSSGHIVSFCAWDRFFCGWNLAENANPRNLPGNSLPLVRMIEFGPGL